MTPDDEMEEHFLDANERMGEALVKIGMALGLPRPRVGVTWGAPEILARIGAARPVLDAAEKWAEFNGSTNELLAALDAYRAASGSVEADTPAEPPPARPPRCVECDGTIFLVGNTARWQHVMPHLRTHAPVVPHDVPREVAATPAAEPAPGVEQAPHFMHTQDVIEDALVGAGYQDLPHLTDIVFVATEAARDALGVCQVCGSGQPGMYPSDPAANSYTGPEECSACDGTGWARALAGAADDTREDPDA